MTGPIIKDRLAGLEMFLAAMKRVSWADLLDEEAEVRPRLRARHNPTMPFLAARTLYNDLVSGKIGGDLFIRRAKHLACVSPEAADTLVTWLRSHAPVVNRGT